MNSMVSKVLPTRSLGPTGMPSRVPETLTTALWSAITLAW